MRRLLTVAAALASLAASSLAPAPPRPPGRLRLATNAALRARVENWARAYASQHPEVKVVVSPAGSDVAMAALYAGKCDVAIIGREATPPEAKAFEWEFAYPPDRRAVAGGSYATPGLSPALGVYVAAGNPLAALSLRELDGVIGGRRLRGQPAEISRWSQLGIARAPSADVIHIYVPDTESGTGRFFRQAVLNGSRALNWDRVRELQPARAVLDALARDPSGLAVTACVAPLPPGVRLVPIRPDGGGAAVAPSAETVADQTYPLGRTIYAYSRRGPAGAPDAVIAAFLASVTATNGAYRSPGAPSP